NLHRARHVRAMPRIRALYNPLFATIEDLLARGRAAGCGPPPQQGATIDFG
ncbi:MAG: hypothetical protein ACO3PC_02790, partial [Steroidobacteraceae bacterium]